jgi:hypothetical protein
MWLKEIKTTPGTVYLLQLQFLPHGNTDISFIVSKLLSRWLKQKTLEGPDDAGCVSNCSIVNGCDVIGHFAVSSSVRTDVFLNLNWAGLWRCIFIYMCVSEVCCICFIVLLTADCNLQLARTISGYTAHTGMCV